MLGQQGQAPQDARNLFNARSPSAFLIANVHSQIQAREILTRQIDKGWRRVWAGFFKVSTSLSSPISVVTIATLLLYNCCCRRNGKVQSGRTNFEGTKTNMTRFDL